MATPLRMRVLNVDGKDLRADLFTMKKIQQDYESQKRISRTS
jgi:hypothetical protein